MAETAATLAFQLYIIACCLFAPADKKNFEIELREGQRDKGAVLYAERTGTGFSIYKTQERKGDGIEIRRDAERYVWAQEQGDKRTDYAIDNSRAQITPLQADGSYAKNIDGAKVMFECKQGVRKVYQEHNDKLFLVR